MECTNYQNLVLQKHQKKLIEFILQPNRKGILAFHSVGSGKCHARDEEIIMYDTTYKKAQDIKLGDQLMGDDSTPRKVISVKTGREDTYDITNVNGESFRVNISHILCLKGVNFPLIEKLYSKNVFVVTYIEENRLKNKRFPYIKTDEEAVLQQAKMFKDSNESKEPVLEISVSEYLNLSDYIKMNLRSYKVGLSFEKINTVLPPYLKGYFSICKDIEIPVSYIRNSAEVRYQLLGGIIDSCGDKSVDNTVYKIVIKNTLLREQVKFLIRSLGLNAFESECNTIIISGINVIDIPSINRNLKIKTHEDTLLYKFTVKLAKMYDEYFGFTLSGNSRYLVKNFTVTHNTITSLAAAKCLLTTFPYKKIQIITNASLTGNFIREIKNLKLDFKNKIFVDSYGTYLSKVKKNKGNTCEDTILIVDESQSLNGSNSSRFDWIFECSKQAPKVILLSATPIKNSPEEFANQLSLLKGEKVSRSKINNIQQIGNKDTQLKAYKKITECSVSFMKRPMDDTNYPSVDEKIVSIKMSKDYYSEYLKIQLDEPESAKPLDFIKSANLKVFYNGVRRAVNKLDEVSPKVEWAIKKTIEDVSAGKKVLIYSTWINSGIGAIKKILSEKGVRISEVSGRISKKDKDIQVNMFNKGKNPVLLISSSGAEGLNLKGTRTVILLEPHWNQTRTSQVIGRAARFKSHIKLPENERNVTVFHLILTKNAKYTKSWDSLESADVILFRLAKNKQKSIDTFYNGIKESSIENNPECFD